MALNQGKHIIEVIDGARCTLVETGISDKRLQFLKSLLEFNGYVVKVAANEDNTWKIGVTDVVFHAVVDVYKRKMRSPNGHVVTPAYWLQLTEKQTEAEMNYWVQ
jgi:hypothetical protein